jgi:hypothetical protein
MYSEVYDDVSTFLSCVNAQNLLILFNIGQITNATELYIHLSDLLSSSNERKFLLSYMQMFTNSSRTAMLKQKTHKLEVFSSDLDLLWQIFDGIINQLDNTHDDTSINVWV